MYSVDYVNNVQCMHDSGTKFTKLKFCIKFDSMTSMHGNYMPFACIKQYVATALLCIMHIYLHAQIKL